MKRWVILVVVLLSISGCARSIEGCPCADFEVFTIDGVDYACYKFRVWDN